jgi:hypothetical protein
MVSGSAVGINLRVIPTALSALIHDVARLLATARSARLFLMTDYVHAA